jgi:hypothetical protein
MCIPSIPAYAVVKSESGEIMRSCNIEHIIFGERG